MEYLGLSARLVIGAVFLVAALPKLREPRTFERDVAAYQLLPTTLVRPVARVLPALELAVGLALLAGVLIVPVALLASVVLVVFAAAVWISVQRERTIGCGCGFGRRQQVSRTLAVRNAGLTVAALVAALWPSAALALYPGPGVPESTLSASDAVGVVVATTLVAAAVVLGSEWRRFVVSHRTAVAAYQS
jgi:uncharacterized membrane protein YphA (DoxX/SURF4 family)